MHTEGEKVRKREMERKRKNKKMVKGKKDANVSINKRAKIFPYQITHEGLKGVDRGRFCEVRYLNNVWEECFPLIFVICETN